MNFLETILAHKNKEIDERKSLYPVKLLEKSIYFETPVVSLKKYLQRTDQSGIIAEIKRRSPSKGVLNAQISVEQISIGYMQAGASALSVLTDKEFFGGSNDDLITARKYNFCPILRKDFILDEYQILEAKSIGADAVLLIAAILEPRRLRDLSAFAKNLGLEILVEIHSKDELAKLPSATDIVGVNHRDLRTFQTQMTAAIEMAPWIPKELIAIAESGIDSVQTVLELKRAGYSGFLIGENFMIHSRPGQACAEFIKKLKGSA